MSDNIVSFQGRTRKIIEEKKAIDVTCLISSIIDWAENQGVEVDNDIGFQIRCADFMTYLELLVKDGNRKIA
jgi:hypothetical protein